MFINILNTPNIVIANKNQMAAPVQLAESELVIKIISKVFGDIRKGGVSKHQYRDTL